MIKKYIGITLISASLAIVGCSSDDDGDDMMTGGGDGSTPAPEPVVGATEYTPAEGVTLNIVETATNAGNFNTLIAAASDAGLAGTLSDPSVLLTVFAPTDDAFAALGDAVPSGEDLVNVLQFHVADGIIDAAAITAGVGRSAEALNGGDLAFAMEGENLTVNGVMITTSDIQATNGIIHVIDAVMIPPAPAPVDPAPVDGGGDGEPVDGGVNLGISLNALRDAGHTDYVTLHETSGLGTVYDENVWTAFVPTNDVIDDGLLVATQEEAFAILNNHIITTGAFSAADLVGQASGQANGGLALVFGGTADALTVNGFNATPIAIEGAAATVYIIDGVLQ